MNNQVKVIVYDDENIKYLTCYILEDYEEKEKD